jgi:hypothetical protein
MHLLVVPEQHALRGSTEHFIAAVYKSHYQAAISSFPPILVAMLENSGRLLCASGLRFARTGFFSDAYLDIPIEQALARSTGQPICRDDIFEVTTFASRAPHAATRFLEHVVAYGGHAGFEWAFFTATARLRDLLRILNLPFLTLGAADPARLSNSAVWGSYYECAPCVCAVSHGAAAKFLSQSPRSAVHA